MQNLKNLFLLRDDITYLNFGSFGACPKPIFEKYQQFQLELEQEPVQFITQNGLKYLEDSRIALGNYLQCNKDDIVYVTNPSYAVNAVAKSLGLKPGDEILTTDLEYGACDKTWQYYCDKAGAKYVRLCIPLPIDSKEAVVDTFIKGITSKTKLVFISHITSSTGIRLPVEEICAAAKDRGLITFVDGAHAPGQLHLNLKDSPFDIYTGACHKWMMTPKGSSFLYARKEMQNLIDPLIISWGYNAMFPSSSTFIDYHQMNGTRDYSAFLTIPAAIEFMQTHNWWTIANECRKIVKSNAPALCNLLGANSIVPLNDDFIYQMYSAQIATNEPEKLQRYLFEIYKIEIPLMRLGNKVFMRYAINAFNSQADLDHLFDAVTEIKKTTQWITN